MVLHSNLPLASTPGKSRAVPVTLDDDVIAVINVESQVTDAFNEQDQRVIETLAMHVSSATKKLRGEVPLDVDPGKTVSATQ